MDILSKILWFVQMHTMSILNRPPRDRRDFGCSLLDEHGYEEKTSDANAIQASLVTGLSPVSALHCRSSQK